MNQQELFDEFYKALEPIAANDGAADKFTSAGM